MNQTPIIPNERDHFLVPVDFSESSIGALRRGRELARRQGADLHVMHVAPAFHVDWKHDTTQMQQAESDAARAKLDALVRQEFQSGEEPQVHFVNGHPVDEIVKHAGQLNAKLLLIGTTGRGGLRRTIMGSVAERVVRHAPCPVMVVR